MHLVTSARMKAMDRRTIEEFGVPGIDLMNRAGAAVVDEIIDRVGNLSGEAITILCGRGNNGGDGFVIARLMERLNARVSLWLLAEPATVTGDAKLAMDQWVESGGTIHTLSTDEEVAEAAQEWQKSDMIVDAMLGTGLSGDVRGIARTAIEQVGTIRVPVVAVDIPSGISSDTGAVCGVAIKAGLTVTFGLPKIGQAFQPGKEHCGTLTVSDIGLHPQAVEEEAGFVRMTGRTTAREWLPRRANDAHKGDAGKVMLIGTSVGMTGAGVLSSEAALRSGAGLVYLACPESLNDVLETKSTEVITLPMPEVRKHRCFSLRAVGQIHRALEGMNALAIGPGLGRHRETRELVRRILSHATIPTVVDADALFALSPGNFPFDQPVILTPHYGEAARLLGMEIDEIRRDPITVCRDAAEKLGVTMLLKGAPTVVTGPSGETWVNPTGNAGMATAGTGDVLTGMIAGLLGQGVEPETAARLAAFVHGTAGDLARDELGMTGMIAGDILRLVPQAIMDTGKWD
jgi:ADP-dependent NAD(P)H-hydrate dehydratase / NAD(P)H-hydrate epimerase